jgi:hypothetical protein
VLRVLAGFDAEKASYRLQRDFIDPPLELEKLIFPWVDDSFEEVCTLIRQKHYDSEHSGYGFLNLLKLLRRVFLQDAASFYLDSGFSNYLIFQLPLFKSAEFADFQDKIKKTIQDPANKMLFKAGTEIKLNQILESQARQESREQQNFKRLFEEISNNRLGMLLSKIKIRKQQEIEKNY